VYTDDILLTANQHGLLQQIHIEQPVTMPEIHQHCWGTPDCWMFDPVTGILYLYDFKYGHYGVTAYENWQMLCYTLGILRELTDSQPLGDYGITVKVRIVQPRCFHDNLGAFRDWELPATDMRAYVNMLNAAAHAAFKEDAACDTGPWCKHCAGAVRCKAHAGAAANAIDHSDDAVPINMDEMGLGYELNKLERAMELMKTRKEALHADADHRIRNGAAIPGWSMQQSYSNAKWFASDASVLATGKLMGVDFAAPAKVITPSQAKTLLSKSSIDPVVIEGTFGKQPSSMKLVVDDGSKARMVFKS
jgi:hypothetical protein